MRELDKSEIEALWALYNVAGRTRGQFIIEADHKIGDVPKAVLGAIWDAFDYACDIFGAG